MIGNDTRRYRRATVREEGSVLTISMPCPRNWVTVVWFVPFIVFVAYLLTGPLLGISPRLLPQASTLAKGFMAVWAMLLSYSILATLFSREEIIVNDLTLRRRPVLGPYPTGRARTWALNRISNLRPVQNPQAEPRFGAVVARLIDTRQRDVGAIAFDYDRVPHRIGYGIGEDEAAEVVERIKAYAPSLARL